MVAKDPDEPQVSGSTVPVYFPGQERFADAIQCVEWQQLYGRERAGDRHYGGCHFPEDEE